MANRDIQIGKMQAQLDQWGAKLEEFASKSKADAKADQAKVVADLRAKRKIAQAKLKQLKLAGDEKWETMKTGVVNAYDELEGAFKKLVG